MPILFCDDPVEADVRKVLEILDAGGDDMPSLECTRVDLKEEPGRRQGDGTLAPSRPQNEEAAKKLAGEAACMANSDGGGALVVGVADDYRLIGTDIDAEWLRRRIYDHTQRLLTVDVRPVQVRGVRLLVVKAAQALEPIRWNNKIHWRVDDRCVEVDATTWHARRMTRMRYDWSAEPSNVSADHARAAAIESARQFLRESGEDAALDLAAARTPEFLRRLNVVTSDGLLTNAGVLAFVGREDPSLDYIRRDVAGGDSVVRLRSSGRSLLEDLDEVIRVINHHNSVRHQLHGLVVGQVRELPALAVREAIVNGAVHREWGSPAPVTIEHIGHTLTVTSPGGFMGGVTPENIITHPSEPRNRSLAELFAALRVAEREGIGVDRMVRDMLRLGYRAPETREIEGPYVRAALVGDALDVGWLRFVGDLRPHSAGSDLNALLLITRLKHHLWVDVRTAAPLLQPCRSGGRHPSPGGGDDRRWGR